MSFKLRSQVFLLAAVAATETIYLTGDGAQQVSERDIGKAEGRAETVFDDYLSNQGIEPERLRVANVTLSPDYESERLNVDVRFEGFIYNIDLYLGDYGIDLVKSEDAFELTDVVGEAEDATGTV